MPVVKQLFWGLQSLEAGESSRQEAFRRYAREFNSLEISSTYRRVPSLATVARWRSQAPAGFRYSLVAPRVLSYQPSSKERRALRRFLRRAQALGPALGAIRFVVPPGQGQELAAWLLFLPPGQFAFSLDAELAPYVCQAGHTVVNGPGSFQYLIDPTSDPSQVEGYAYFSSRALVNVQ